MKKILMVVTSHSSLGDTDKKTGIWLSEFTEPYFALIENGIDVVFASIHGGVAPIDPTILHKEALDESTEKYFNSVQKVLDYTVPLKDIDFYDFDGIFYLGGYGLVWDLSRYDTNA